MGHQLIGLLGGRVVADGVVHRIAFGKRHLGVAAIDAGAAGIDQMLDLVLAAALQDIAKAQQIRVGVVVGLIDGVAHTGLCGQVQNFAGPLGKQVGHACRSARSSSTKRKWACGRNSARRACLSATS
jgi:hypothetical protein